MYVCMSALAERGLGDRSFKRRARGGFGRKRQCGQASGDPDLSEIVWDTVLSADQEVALQQIAKRKANQQTAVQIRKRVSKTFEHMAKMYVCLSVCQLTRPPLGKEESSSTKLTHISA